MPDSGNMLTQGSQDSLNPLDPIEEARSQLREDPEWNYGSIVPIRQRKTLIPGGTNNELAIPGMLRHMLTGGLDLLQGPSTAEGQFADTGRAQMSPDALGDLMMVPGGVAGAVGTDATLGMFFGAKGARQMALGGQKGALTDLWAAQRADAAGVKMDDIWRRHGWTQGPEGEWRGELDDSKARYKSLSDDDHKFIANGGQVSTTIQQMLDHPKLFSAYPDFRDAPITIKSPAEMGYTWGYWRPKVGAPASQTFPGEFVIRSDIAKDPEKGKSTLLHEIQHGIQEGEGFAPGANSRSFIGSSESEAIIKEGKSLSNDAHTLYEKMADDVLEKHPGGMTIGDPRFLGLDGFGDLIKEHPDFERYQALRDKSSNYQFTPEHEAYMRTHGEVEARNTEERLRLGLTDLQRRNTPPQMTEDRPRAQQIFGPGLGPAWSMAPINGHPFVYGASQSIKGFHGTPHTFEPVEGNPFGEFRDSAIGSGEGNQAYGYGHYVAGNIATAEDYARKLGDENGNLLHIEIKPGEHELLDWDRPLGEHSKVLQDKILPLIQPSIERQEAAKQDILYRARTPGTRLPKPSTIDNAMLPPVDPMTLTGAQVYNRIGAYLPNGKMVLNRQEAFPTASAALHQAGIPGIKYLDQGSRRSAASTARDIAELEGAINSKQNEIGSIQGVLDSNKNNPGLFPRFFESRQQDMKNLQDQIIGHKQQIEDLKSGKHLTHNYVIFHPKNLRITGRNGQMLEPIDHDPFNPK